MVAEIKKYLLIIALVVGLLTPGWFRQPSTNALASGPGNLSQLENVETGADAVTIHPLAVQEGNDYASQVLLDPWDMQEFSDISRYLNELNVVTHLEQIQVVDGIFSAVTASSDPQFYTLFPGYQSSIDVLSMPVKPGSLFPIDFEPLSLLLQPDAN